MVELKYAQQFAELTDLGKQYTAVATSKIGNVSKFVGQSAENPYDDYIKTALNISKSSEYPLWQNANEKVEAFFDSGFRMAKQVFTGVKDGELDWTAANNQAAKFGLGKPFANAADYLEQQKMIAPTPYLRKFVQGVNGIMAATTLRLDQMNALVNTISTPILLGHEVSVLRKNFGSPDGIARLNDLLTTTVPDGSSLKIPATTKLLWL
jgi:hypothetical protein